MSIEQGNLLRVEAPAMSPNPYGLFSVVTPRLDGRFLSGIQWESIACGANVGVTVDPCVDPDTPPLPVPEPVCDWVAYEPFHVFAQANRTPVEGDAIRMATNRLTSGEQVGVEQVIWTMIEAEAAAPTAIGGPLSTLAYIEARLAELYGGQGVLHMGMILATLLSDHLRISGGQMTTMLGTPVVVGAGYEPPGPPPAAPAEPVPSTATIFGTGPIVMYRTDIEEIADPDLDTNRTRAMVSRGYVVGWDCVAVGASASITTEE